MTTSSEIQMLQQAITPVDVLPQPIVDTGATKGSDKGINIVDRIALAAAFSVAMFILVMFALTYKSTMQPMPAAVSIVMSPYAGLHGSAPDRHRPNASRKD
jgi:DMSO/TMAO reductase YedYZ heme-binding membrane subunit